MIIVPNKSYLIYIYLFLYNSCLVERVYALNKKGVFSIKKKKTLSGFLFISISRYFKKNVFFL